MDNYQKYYVYQHIDPETKEIAYIGMGKGSRAWQYGTYRGKDKSTSYGHRSSAHTDWCEQQVSKGFLPCDFVEILQRNLTKSEAHTIEASLLRQHKPLYNGTYGLCCLKMDLESTTDARLLRGYGMSYLQIADALGFGAMTIYRALTGKTLNVTY